jgi:HK97 family phage portal protein
MAVYSDHMDGAAMSLLTRLVHRLNQPMLPPSQRALPYYGGYPSYQYGKAVWPKYNATTFYGYYDQVVVAFACINLIADAASSAKVRVYDSAKDDAELPDHPMRQLLGTPNDYMSEAEFYNVMVKMAAVAGFAVAEKERSGAGRVVGLHPLRSDWLKPVPRENNMTDWEYKLPSGETYPLLAEDVVAWTYQGTPTLDATGLSPLCAANREIAIENSMTNFIKAFFDGGGVPMIGLVPDPDAAEMTQAEAEVMREAFQQLSSEPWRPIVLQTIKDVKRLGFDLNEMAYQDLRDLTATQICTAFRVPPGMIGTLAGMERNTFTNYGEQRRSFYEDTITPLWARLDGALTRSLLPDFESKPSVSLEFDTSGIPAFDEDDTAEWAKIGAAITGGWLPVNVGLQMLGVPAITGGDIFLRSIAQVEVPASEQNGNRSMNGHATIIELEPGFPKYILGDTTCVSPQAARFYPHPNGTMHRLLPETRARVASTNKQQMLKVGERGAVWLRTFWKDQGERIIADLGLRQSNLVALSLRAVDLVDWDEEERLLRQQVTQIHNLAGTTAYHQAGELLNVDIAWDLANPNVSRLLGRLATRVVGLHDTTRQDVQRVVGDSLTEGVTLHELGDRLTGLFVETYQGRAETVGRTESMIAYNQASTLGYQESGVVSMVELVDNPDHTEDYGASDGLTCADRDGLIVDLDAVDTHIEAEHPNGSLAVIPVLSTALGDA